MNKTCRVQYAFGWICTWVGFVILFIIIGQHLFPQLKNKYIIGFISGILSYHLTDYVAKRCINED